MAVVVVEVVEVLVEVVVLRREDAVVFKHASSEVELVPFVVLLSETVEFDEELLVTQPAAVVELTNIRSHNTSSSRPSSILLSLSI